VVSKIEKLYLENSGHNDVQLDERYYNEIERFIDGK